MSLSENLVDALDAFRDGHGTTATREALAVHEKQGQAPQVMGALYKAELEKARRQIVTEDKENERKRKEAEAAAAEKQRDEARKKVQEETIRKKQEEEARRKLQEEEALKKAQELEQERQQVEKQEKELEARREQLARASEARRKAQEELAGRQFRTERIQQCLAIAMADVLDAAVKSAPGPSGDALEVVVRSCEPACTRCKALSLDCNLVAGNMLCIECNKSRTYCLQGIFASEDLLMHHSLGCAVHRSVVVNALEMLGSMSAKGRKRAGVSLRKGEGLLRSVLENAGTL